MTGSGAGSRSGGMPGQERQRLRVELLDVLIDRRVCAVVEDEQLRVLDGLRKRTGEPGRYGRIEPPERDLRRSLNATKHLGRVVREHGVGLAQERVHRRHWPAAYEVGERVDVLRLGFVKLRGKAPGENALDDHVG